MNILITGVAGFIGSHLADRLISQGHTVIGIDCFTDYYARSIKENNIKEALQNKQFTFLENDLSATCDSVLTEYDVEIVYHLAAQAGVRRSWGKSFEVYTNLNILGTQKLLEQCVKHPVKRFIYASSSSVYGNCDSLPLEETSTPMPVSPYGVTKLAAEHLVQLYNKDMGLPTVSLRYFTVFGPRQRPDMAFHKFIRQSLRGKPIQVYGDGKQTRDFTFVGDITTANIAAMKAPAGSILNIGGGNRISLIDSIKLIEKVIGSPIRIDFEDKQRGDMKHTFADISQAQNEINYNPTITLEDGLSQEIEWIQTNSNILD